MATSELILIGKRGFPLLSIFFDFQKYFLIITYKFKGEKKTYE